MNSAFRFAAASALTAMSLLSVDPSWADSSGDWPRFHGAEGIGHAPQGTIPSNWTASDYAWRHDLGSRDVGSPIVIDGKVYVLVSMPEQQKIALESFDLATGKRRWSKQFSQLPHHLHARNTLASSTPTADADHVYVAWADDTHTYLKCLDHSGEEVWSRDFGTWRSQHGFGTSPRIVGSLVLLFDSQQAEQMPPGQAPGKSRVIAVDATTGNTVWETPLTATRTCYGIPAIYRGGETPQVIGANTGNGMFGIDLESGRLLWNAPVFEMRCCSTPLIAGDLAIGSSGSGGGGNHLVAVRIPKSPGESPQQVYRIDRGAPYVPTPVLKDGRLFMVDDKGIASCVDAQTGETVWTQRIGGNFGASPVVIGDRLLLISLDGQATVLKAADEFEKLGEVDLEGPVGATPAFAEGRLLLRVGSELRCLGGKSI